MNGNMPGDEFFGDGEGTADASARPMTNGAAPAPGGVKFTEPDPAPAPAGPPLPATALAPSLVRMDRRCTGIEKPIPLPWPVLADHFGGGLWPGLHILNAGTGHGKTQWALQVGLHAEKQGIPVFYVGLELGELDLVLRLIGEEAHVPWSHLWTGKAGPAYVARAHEVAPVLKELLFHYVVAPPHGLPTSDLRVAVEGFRALYPETNGPGSRPLLLIVDFLQLIGDEPGDEKEMRVRIGRASYALRDFANRLGIAVLCISSIARERYKLCNELQEVGELKWDADADGCPINRRILNPDAIVGAGKESGDIEYSADTVSILARVSETWDGHGCDAVLATAKGRATGAMWSPLHFSGFGFSECSDRGGRMVEAWKQEGEKRERAKEQRQSKKEQETAAKILADAVAVARYVLAHPDCNVTEAKVNTVTDNPRRWKPAVAKLTEAALRPTKLGKSIRLSLNVAALPAEVRALIADATSDVGRSPPYTPPPSASDVDGRGPSSDAGQRRTSEVSDVSEEARGEGAPEAVETASEPPRRRRGRPRWPRPSRPRHPERP
jgi:hypothetical protein